VAPIDKFDKQQNKELIGINQDANLFVSELKPGASVRFELDADRQIYLLCIEGNLNVHGNDATLKASLTSRDALEIVGNTKLVFEAPSSAPSNALMLMIEMKKP